MHTSPPVLLPPRPGPGARLTPDSLQTRFNRPTQHNHRGFPRGLFLRCGPRRQLFRLLQAPPPRRLQNRGGRRGGGAARAGRARRACCFPGRPSSRGAHAPLSFRLYHLVKVGRFLGNNRCGSFRPHGMAVKSVTATPVPTTGWSFSIRTRGCALGLACLPAACRCLPDCAAARCQVRGASLPYCLPHNPSCLPCRRDAVENGYRPALDVTPLSPLSTTYTSDFVAHVGAG